MNEQTKMTEGLLCNQGAPELQRQMSITKESVWKFNSLPPSRHSEAMDIFHQIVEDAAKDVDILAPLNIDYGFNVHIGKRFFANSGMTIFDICPVNIGDFCMFGPNVSIFTANHPLDSEIRREHGGVMGSPVNIGDNVWIGGNTTIMGGVSVGDGAVIGAGSVVVCDIPSNVLAAGNPCRIIRRLGKADKDFWNEMITGSNAWDTIHSSE